MPRPPLIVSLPALPLDLLSGTYTFQAVAVEAGKDAFNEANWLGKPASAKLTLTK